MIKQDKPNISDKILAATFLRLFPNAVTPNQITMFLFFTVPLIAFLLWTGKYGIGMILFAISAFSDALDGALARTKKKITAWGTAYDPVADKFLIGVTAFVILPRYINPLLVFAIISLEVLLIGLVYYGSTHKKTFMVKANWWGKSKMIAQSFGVMAVLVYIVWPHQNLLVLANYILWIALLLSVASLISYGFAGKK